MTHTQNQKAKQATDRNKSRKDYSHSSHIIQINGIKTYKNLTNIFIQSMAKTHAHKTMCACTYACTHTHTEDCMHTMPIKSTHVPAHTHTELRRTWEVGVGVKTNLKAKARIAVIKSKKERENSRFVQQKSCLLVKILFEALGMF